MPCSSTIHSSPDTGSRSKTSRRSAPNRDEVHRILVDDAQNHQARELTRRICPYVSEPPIQRRQDPLFNAHDFGDRRITTSAQPLAQDRGHVVTVCEQERGDFVGKILVQLEAHQAAPGMKGITSSRASSAAYAIAASTSSGFKDG